MERDRLGGGTPALSPGAEGRRNATRLDRLRLGTARRRGRQDFVLPRRGRGPGKVPRGLKPRGFPDDPSPRFRGGIQARVSSSGVLTCRLCRVSRRGCVVSILRSPRLVSWGSSPGVPDPWYWLTFYAGSLPVPATAYVRRLDRTGNGPVIKDRLFLSTFVGAASSTALERAWHPPRFIGDSFPAGWALGHVRSPATWAARADTRLRERLACVPGLPLPRAGGWFAWTLLARSDPCPGKGPALAGPIHGSGRPLPPSHRAGYYGAYP